MKKLFNMQFRSHFQTKGLAPSLRRLELGLMETISARSLCTKAWRQLFQLEFESEFSSLKIMNPRLISRAEMQGAGEGGEGGLLAGKLQLNNNRHGQPEPPSASSLDSLILLRQISMFFKAVLSLMFCADSRTKDMEADAARRRRIFGLMAQVLWRVAIPSSSCPHIDELKLDLLQQLINACGDLDDGGGGKSCALNSATPPAVSIAEIKAFSQFLHLHIISTTSSSSRFYGINESLYRDSLFDFLTEASNGHYDMGQQFARAWFLLGKLT